MSYATFTVASVQTAMANTAFGFPYEPREDRPIDIPQTPSDTTAHCPCNPPRAVGPPVTNSYIVKHCKSCGFHDINPVFVRGQNDMQCPLCLKVSVRDRDYYERLILCWSCGRTSSALYKQGHENQCIPCKYAFDGSETWIWRNCEERSRMDGDFHKPRSTDMDEVHERFKRENRVFSRKWREMHEKV